MDDKCQNCACVAVLQRDVDELKSNVKEIDKRISIVEIDSGKRDEKMLNLETLLLEIKADVKEIKGEKSKELSSKLKFLLGILSGVSIAVIGTLIIQGLKVFHW